MIGITRLSGWLNVPNARADRASCGYLHSAARFKVLLQKERMRSARSGLPFSLLALAIGDENSRTGNGSSGNGHLARIEHYLERRLRLTDEAGWLDDGQIGVLLPDTPAEGARVVATDVNSRCAAEGLTVECRIYTYPSDTPDKPDPPAPGSGNGQSKQTTAARPQSDKPVRALETLFIRRMPAWKRAIDVIGATTGLIVLFPLFVLVAAAIKLTSPGPVLFTQMRRGRGGVKFRMWKFRSMVTDAEARKAGLRQLSEQDGPAFKMDDDPRVTALGRFLRRSSIDEIPQLWNVLGGEMSLVGPRPLPCDESDGCALWQKRRLDVTPGLTCLWQINGRSKVSFDEWVRMDMEYLRTIGPVTDLLILLKTIPAVLLRRGAK